jgi:thiamine kinase-like enzyme
MSAEQIKNIEDLIPLGDGKKIVDYKIKRLTTPGENRGSLMLKVDFTVKTSTGNEEIHAAAKAVLPNEFIQEHFNTPVTFRNEIAFYKKIIPLLQDFQRQHGVKDVIDFVPKYYGSRLNLKGDEGKVDQDAVLLLENLKVANYTTVDRTQGFDLDAAKLIITDLAQFHAVPLALKLEKPDVFEREIKPFLMLWTPKEQQRSILNKQVSRLIDDIEELKPLKEKILIAFDDSFTPRETRETFATITHNDCWVNNFLLKLENGKSVKSVMVDYQLCSYGSPARDIVFFLFSSVQDDVLRKHYDDLIKLYYQIFISTLEQLKCVTTPFTFEALEEELSNEARYSQFGHVTFMLYPIFIPEAEVRDITEVGAKMMFNHKIPDIHKRKFVSVVNEFIKRKWISM